MNDMYSMNPTFYLLLFSTALVITYLVVRLGWVRASSALIAGMMLNTLFFYLYATARQNEFSHALLVGATLGIVFTGFSVSLGVLFRHDLANQEVTA